MIDGTDDPTTPGQSSDQSGGQLADPVPPPPGSEVPPPAGPEVPPPVGGPRRLVRDPTARLGGVASGLSHYLGIDGSLLRVGFVVFTLFSGIGLVAYLLLWVVVPRSEYWPPLHSQPIGGPSRLSNRDVLLSFVILIALASLIFQAGWGGSWLIGLLMVAAAVWLLNQDAQPVQQASSEWSDQTTAYPGPAFAGTADGAVPVRVEPRRRRRVFIAFVIAILLLLAALFVAIVTALVVLADGDFDFDSGELRAEAIVEVEPTSVDDIPTMIDSGAGEVILDLGQLEAADFEGADPIEVEVSLGVGQIVVVVPEDLDVDVSAYVGAGDLTLFDEYEDGLRRSASFDGQDEVLDLDLSVTLGEIRVERD